MIRTTKENIMCITYHQDNTFKRFKEKETFPSMVTKFNVNKNTIIFKINIVTLIDK